MFKKFTMAMASALCFSLSFTVQADPVSSTEYQAVLETANNYFSGLATGNQEMIAKAFDLEAGHLKYVTTNKETGEEYVRVISFDEFAKQFTEYKTETWKSEILSIDIVDNHMALVKLNFDTPRTHYVDYLVMYKRKAGWRIVSKTFVAHQLNEQK